MKIFSILEPEFSEDFPESNYQVVKKTELFHGEAFLNVLLDIGLTNESRKLSTSVKILGQRRKSISAPLPEILQYCKFWGCR